MFCCPYLKDWRFNLLFCKDNNFFGYSCKKTFDIMPSRVRTNRAYLPGGLELEVDEGGYFFGHELYYELDYYQEDDEL